MPLVTCPTVRLHLLTSLCLSHLYSVIFIQKQKKSSKNSSIPQSVFLLWKWVICLSVHSCLWLCPIPWTFGLVAAVNPGKIPMQHVCSNGKGVSLCYWRVKCGLATMPFVHVAVMIISNHINRPINYPCNHVTVTMRWSQSGWFPKEGEYHVTLLERRQGSRAWRALTVHYISSAASSHITTKAGWLEAMDTLNF